ncbi:MAG: hypothetical protein V3U16_05795 [Candidatus Neomarinimicrobiota bacterium]
MAGCNVLLPGGVNGDCQIPLEEVLNVWVTDKDLSYSYTGKKSLSGWKADIQQNLTNHGAAGLDSFNNTTDDPNVVTGAVSKAKKITSTPLPSFEFFLDSNFCDFKEVLQTLEGGNYGIFYELQDGTLLGSIDTSGTEIGYFKPFKCNITASSKLLQETDATTAFKVFVNHTNKQQLKDQFIFDPVWDIAELHTAMPNGLSLVATAVYAAGDQTVHVNNRCASNKTGILLVDWDENESLGNVDTPAVTAIVEDGAGDYTLTVQKDSVPADLVDDDFAVIRVNIISGSDTTDLSGYISVEGVT